jgi:hypothetical protein
MQFTIFCLLSIATNFVLIYGLPHGFGVGMPSSAIDELLSNSKENMQENPIEEGVMAAPPNKRQMKARGRCGICGGGGGGEEKIEKSREQVEVEAIEPILEEEKKPMPKQNGRKGSGGNVNDFRINQRVGGNGAVISIKNFN